MSRNGAGDAPGRGSGPGAVSGRILQDHCLRQRALQKCKVCNPDHCNFPGKTVPAMEACGIDVFATVRANGLEIHTLRDPGEVQNHFGLVLVE